MAMHFISLVSCFAFLAYTTYCTIIEVAEIQYIKNLRIPFRPRQQILIHSYTFLAQLSLEFAANKLKKSTTFNNISIFSMVLTLRLLLGATSLLYAARTATAIPHASNNLPRTLAKRNQVTFEDCGGETDDKRRQAGQAWSEAANLAAFTIDGTLDDGTSFKDTNA